MLFNAFPSHFSVFPLPFNVFPLSFNASYDEALNGNENTVLRSPHHLLAHSFINFISKCTFLQANHYETSFDSRHSQIYYLFSISVLLMIEIIFKFHK